MDGFCEWLTLWFTPEFGPIRYCGLQILPLKGILDLMPLVHAHQLMRSFQLGFDSFVTQIILGHLFPIAHIFGASFSPLQNPSSYDELGHLGQWVLYVGFAAELIADGTVTVSQLVFLHRLRTGIRRYLRFSSFGYSF